MIAEVHTWWISYRLRKSKNTTKKNIQHHSLKINLSKTIKKKLDEKTRFPYLGLFPKII